MERKKRIKYFSYYGCGEAIRQRDNSPAADSKTDYIISVLNHCGYAVDHVSRASSSCQRYLSGYVEKRGENTLRYFSSFRHGRGVLRVLNRWFMNVQLFMWCMFNVKRGEQVIVYHSLGYDALFIRLFQWRKVRIIGEIEEIYQDVCRQKKSQARNEYRFIDICSKYIFPTSLLDDKLNVAHKPSVIVHGVYTAEPIVEQKFDDGKIHVVYGGTLDPNKGGAAAAAAAAFLPKNYHIHICGFGDPAQIERVVRETSKQAEATVTFEGELKGEAYKRFIQRCHIGLSTQDPKAAFNATSFPSKILVYLSNGLKVVSIRIPAIEQSAVADCLFFYDEQTPQKIAEAIEKAVKVEQSGENVLKMLDETFKEQMQKLINENTI